MSARWVDFHCHLDLYPDPVAAIRAADEAGVYTLTVTTTPRAWPRNLEITKNTKYVRAALGLHPQLIADHSDEISLWESYLPETRYVGEVGLDAGPRYYRSLDLQKQVFQRVLEKCADAGGKVLTVHSVRAVKTVLDMAEKYFSPNKGKIVLHWFTGTKSEAKRAADLGCYFSINAQMLNTERGMDLISSLPVDRLLTETDGPFTQVQGRPSIPADVESTSRELGKMLKMPHDVIAEAVRQNLKALLGAEL